VFGARLVATGRVRIEELVAEPAPPAALCVRLALTGSRADTAVEKLVELGVERIGPLETAGMRRDARTDRWCRIAAAAAGQAKRPRIPEILPAVTLTEALEQDGAVLLSHEEPDARLDSALARAGRPVLLLVGRSRGSASRSMRRPGPRASRS
jgi:RsmE family RNA methyltransferase